MKTLIVASLASAALILGPAALASASNAPVSSYPAETSNVPGPTWGSPIDRGTYDDLLDIPDADGFQTFPNDPS